MFCKRIIYINWGNIPNTEFELGPVNLFSGGNGSGKTTAADGLQSLMTAAYENLYNFNPGQDETTQRGRGGKQVRTLASYILGCDDGSFARLRMTDGYIAGVFAPTQGESGEPFSAVMCVRAHIDASASPRQARQDELKFLILPDQELFMSDFIRSEAAGKSVLTLDEISQHFQLQYGRNKVEQYDKKGMYLRRLYGAFKGQRSAVSDREAKHAARTFANFMAYKPVKSISDFVANQILEPKDISEDIRQVSELMKTIHSMEEETRRISEAIANLQAAQQCSEGFIEHWLARALADYALLAQQYNRTQQNYLTFKEQARLNQQDADTAVEDIAQLNAKKQNLHNLLVELEAQRQGIEALKTKDELEASIEANKAQLQSKSVGFLTQHQQFETNHKAATELQSKLADTGLALSVPLLASADFNATIKKLSDGARGSNIDVQQLFTKDWVGIASLEHSLEQVLQLERSHAELARLVHQSDAEQGLKSLRDQVLAQHGQAQTEMQTLQKQGEQKQSEIKRLQGHSVNYPRHVSEALAAIKQYCPEAQPAVLCDYIEVTDPAWQMAIEGYMGGARFSIIVDPDYEAQAIRIVRGLKGKRNNAKVIQGAKAQQDALRSSLTKGSIVEVMSFSHKIAQYFVEASYGSVLRVADEHALKSERRAITPEGLGSGNYSMFRCDIDDGDLVFGQGARERALAAKEQELQALQVELNRSTQDYHRIGRISDLMDNIQAVECSAIINELLVLYRAMQRDELKLEALDLSDFEDLQMRLDEAKREHQEVSDKAQQLEREMGKYEQQAKVLAGKIKQLSDDKEQLETEQDAKEQVLHTAASHYPELDTQARLAKVDEALQQGAYEADLEEQKQAAESGMEQSERRLYQHITEHNQHSASYNEIAYFEAFGAKHEEGFFKAVAGLKKQIASVYNTLNNNVLVGKHERLAELKDSFNTAFVTNLCHSIYQAINEGKRVLKDLNKELEHHVFGTDQERFSFDAEWLPEFREYYRFFKEVIDMPNLGDGASLFDSELSLASSTVRDRLLGMLLDKDSQSAFRELERISDYRNYRRYEIYKTPLNKQAIALSKYGTGSGGQLETPAYIIRSAAVTSAFKFNEGAAHCRMVLVDEAFSKMDEIRSREVINYLTEALGLQLIFIMPTSKSGPFMDLISHQVVFSKCPTQSKVGELETQVLVDRKVCNTEKIKDLWANHRKTVRHQGLLDFMEDIEH